jgi:hypothetical protein
MTNYPTLHWDTNESIITAYYKMWQHRQLILLLALVRTPRQILGTLLNVQQQYKNRCSLCFVDRCLSFFFCPWCCLSFIDLRFWLSLWYFQTLLAYLIEIFALFYYDMCLLFNTVCLILRAQQRGNICKC